MTLEEIESIIDTWPHPWPELLGLYRTSRDEKIRYAEDPEERSRVEKEYSERVMRMINEGASN